MPSTTPTDSEAQQRGRSASPKRLVSSAGSSRTSSVVPGSAPVVKSPLGSAPVEGNHDEQPKLDVETEERPRVTLVERVTTEWTRPAATRPQEAPSRPAPNPQASDDSGGPEPLAIAAAEYPWLYMSSTLDACFRNDEQALPSVRPTTQSNTASSEAGPSEPPGLPTEKLKFVDDESDKFTKTAPVVMQAFHAHGETYSRIEAEALKLAMHGPESKKAAGGNDGDGEDDYEDDDEANLQVYHDMLDELEKLHSEALELEASLVELTESPEAKPTATTPESTNEDGGKSTSPTPDATDVPSQPITSAPESSKEVEGEPSAKSQILSLIAASLPVLRARIMNIVMAQELVDSALENVTIGLRMESLGIE